MRCRFTHKVQQLASGKHGMKYAGDEVEAFKAVAAAYKARSVKDFEAAVSKYPKQLKDDEIVDFHLSSLRNTLLEQVSRRPLSLRI